MIPRSHGFIAVRICAKNNRTSVLSQPRSGAWKYKEYDYVNTTGSFLYEPAGSVHTLQCIEDNTQVWFQMHGSNINLDGDGNITSVADGMITLEFYFAMCAEMGKPNPPVLVD